MRVRCHYPEENPRGACFNWQLFETLWRLYQDETERSPLEGGIFAERLGNELGNEWGVSRRLREMQREGAVTQLDSWNPTTKQFRKSWAPVALIDEEICPTCGKISKDVTRSGPGEVFAAPCGCPISPDEALEITSKKRVVADGGQSVDGTEQIVDRLKSDDVVLELTHGEGKAFYGWIDGDLHHHRDHHRAESCEPGEESFERLKIDADYLPMFNPEFIPFDQGPFNRSVDTGTDQNPVTDGGGDGVLLEREHAETLLEATGTLRDDIANGRDWGVTNEDTFENAGDLEDAHRVLQDKLRARGGEADVV